MADKSKNDAVNESDNYAAPPALKDAWKQLLVWRKEGVVLEPNSLANAIVLLKHSARYRGLFVRDAFSDMIFVHKCPPWEEESDFKIRKLAENDVVHCTAALEYDGLSPNVTRTRQAIEGAAKLHEIHPVREYFSRLEWDGDKRLHMVLEDYFGARTQPGEYLGPIFTKWMVAGVKRVFEPGAKFDHMIVLEGAQNIGKSRALRTLATFGRDVEMEYFTDAIRFETIHESGSIIAMQGKLIIEFSELAGLARKEIENVKNWITIEKDEVQKKYQNEVTIYPRQFILAGTTNEDSWLRDATGNRRFLPVKCGGRIDIDGLRLVREQLWAEAYWLYKDGYETMIDFGSELEILAATEQQTRLIEDAWTEAVIGLIRNADQITINELLQGLPVDPSRRDENSARRVGRIMRMLGWTPSTKSVNGRNVRSFKNPHHRLPDRNQQSLYGRDEDE